MPKFSPAELKSFHDGLLVAPPEDQVALLKELDKDPEKADQVASYAQQNLPEHGPDYTDTETAPGHVLRQYGRPQPQENIKLTGPQFKPEETPAYRLLGAEGSHDLRTAFGTVAKGVVEAPFGLADLIHSGIKNNVFTGFPQTLNEYMASPEAMAPKVDQYLTNMGMDRPETSTGRVLGAAVGSLFGPGAAASKAAAFSNMAGGAAGATVGEMGGGADAQLLAGLTAAHAPKFAAQGVRHIIRGDTSPTIAANIDQYGQAGTSPSADQAMATPGAGKFAAKANSARFAGSALADQRDLQQTQLGQHTDNIVQSMTGGNLPSPKTAGGNFLTNLLENFKPAQKAAATSRYALYDKLVSPDIPVDATPLRDFISGTTKPIPGLENTSADPSIASGLSRLAPAVLKDLQEKFSSILGPDGKPISMGDGTHIPVSSIGQMKTRVGEMLETAPVESNGSSLNAAEAQQLYATLSKLQRSAAIATDGGKEGIATKMFDDNNAQMTKYYDTLRQVRSSVNAGTNEDIFRKLVLGSGDGDTKLSAAYSTLPPEGQQALSAAILKNRILRPSPENRTVGEDGTTGTGFSMQDTLLNWKKLSPDAQRTIMQGMGPGYAKDFSNVMQVMDKINSQAKYGKIDYSTVNHTGLGYIAAGGAGELYAASHGHTGYAALAGGVVGTWAAVNRLMPNLMTNPKFVSWLSKTNDIPKTALPMAINQLGHIAARSQDAQLAAGAQALSQAVGQGPQ